MVKRTTVENVWRIVRVGALTVAHSALIGATVNASWTTRTGAVAGAVGLSEAVYRVLFPQGSRKVSGWIARALVIVQGLAAEAPVPAANPGVTGGAVSDQIKVA